MSFGTRDRFIHRPSAGPVVLLVFLAGLGYAVVQGPSWWWALSYAVHFVIFSFGVGFGLHRLVAHRVPGPPVWVIRFAVLAGALAQVGSPVSWLTLHRQHHAHSDDDRDPHSPRKLGWRVILNIVIPPSKDSVVESLLDARAHRDPFWFFLHRYYYLLSVFYALACFAGLGTNGLVYAALLPMGSSFLSVGLLNYFAHGDLGYRNFATGDRSCNVWWLWPLTFGENWHNNHHDRPAHPTSRHRPFELDPIYFYFVLTRSKG